MTAEGQVPGLRDFSCLPPGCSTSRMIGTHYSSWSSYSPSNTFPRIQILRMHSFRN